MVFVYAALIVALFAATILLSLKARKRIQAASRKLRARDVWEPFQDSGWPFDDLLYGVSSDFSATEPGLIVRDAQDRELGTIMFHTGARQSWITFETNEGHFVADVLPAWRRSVRFHATGNDETICTVRSLPWGTYRFNIPGSGLLESKPPRTLRPAPLFRYTLDGHAAGAARHIGGSVNRGVALILPGHIPLPVRMFVLAMQRQRA